MGNILIIFQDSLTIVLQSIYIESLALIDIFLQTTYKLFNAYSKNNSCTIVIRQKF